LAGIDYKLARKAMVDGQIAVSSVVDRRLLAAFLDIPRERFLPEDRRAMAYSDVPHPLGNGRVLPPAVQFARIAQLAAIGPQDRVLDVGSGSGYSAAILARLAVAVVAYEGDKELVTIAQHTLGDLDITNVSVVTDIREAQAAGPYDVILLEQAILEPPETYLSCLALGGRLVAVVGLGRAGVATLWTRTAEGVVSRPHFNASLPTHLPDDRREEFVF